MAKLVLTERIQNVVIVVRLFPQNLHLILLQEHIILYFNVIYHLIWSAFGGLKLKFYVFNLFPIEYCWMTQISLTDRQLEFINPELARIPGESTYVYLKRIKLIALPELSEEFIARLAFLHEWCRFRPEMVNLSFFCKIHW